MSDAHDFSPYIGRAVFPTHPGQLRDAGLCPACFTPHSGHPVCGVCLLELSNPLVHELLAISVEAADSMDERLQLIGQIRFQTNQAAIAAQQAQQARLAQQAARAQQHAAQQASTPSAPARQDPDDAHPPTLAGARPAEGTLFGAQRTDTGTPAAAPRRSSVQVLLVVIGVSLLSLFALGLLTYAFVFYGVLARSLILGALTAAAFTAAQLLRRRGLIITGEGLAVVGMVLLAIDLWAVRANDFFGLAAVDGQPYFALCLLGTSVLYWLWHRLSGLRSASIVAAAQVIPGTLMLAHSFLPGQWPIPNALTTALLAGAAAAALHWLLPRSDARYWVERWILHGMALPSLLLAGILSFELQDPRWLGSLGFAAAALVAGGHAVSITVKRAGARWKLLAGLWWALTTAALALTPAQALVHTGAWQLGLVAQPLLPVLLLLVAEWIATRTAREADPGAPVLSATRWVRSTAIVMAAATALQLLLFLGGTLLPWALFALDTPLLLGSPPAFYAILGLSITVTALGIGWFLLGTLAKRAVLFTSLAMPVALLAPLALPSRLGTMIGYLLLAAALLTALGLPLLQRSPRRSLVRIPVWAGFGLATLSGYLTAHSSDLSWWIGAPALMIMAVALFILARASIAQLLLGIGATLLLALLVLQSLSRFEDLPWQLLPAVLVIALGAWLLLALLPLQRPAPIARDAAMWTALPILAVSYAVSADAARPLAELWAQRIDVMSALGIALAALGIAHGLRSSASAALRTVSSAAAAAAAATGAAGLGDIIAWPFSPGSTIAASVALLAVAFALLLRLLRSARLRPLGLGLELGALVLVLPAALIMSSSPWLILLLAAAALLMTALTPVGLFGSTSPRKALIWPAAVLATAALWLQLSDHRIETPEAYTLPLAGLILLLAAVFWLERLRESAAPPAPQRSKPLQSAAARPVPRPPWAALTGLVSVAALLALLPSAFASAPPGSSRGLWVALAAGLLALTASWLPQLLQGPEEHRPRHGLPVLLGLAASAMLTLAVLSWVQLWRLRERTPFTVAPDAGFELWLWMPVAIILLSALGIALSSGLGERGTRVLRGFLVLLLIQAALATAILAGSGTTALIRALLLMLLLAAVIVACAQLERTPLDHQLGVTTAVIAGVTGLSLLYIGSVRTVEWLSIPLALGLLTAGWIRMDRDPELRSWRTLGVGLAVLLLPSLFAIADHSPVWRLVGLGAVATAVLIIGVIRRLQAPFLLGSIVLLVHLLTQGWPLISQLAREVPYFIWLGIAGIAVIWLAARYERRVRDLRATVSRIRALR